MKPTTITSPDERAPNAEERRLRQWLHRIEEAAAVRLPDAGDIRDACLAALRGYEAPKGPGLPDEQLRPAASPADLDAARRAHEQGWDAA